MQKQEAQLVKYLTEYIEKCLEELRYGNAESLTEIVCGEIYAYIECLEIILTGKGVNEETLRELELKYGVI